MTPTVLFEQKDGIARLRFNRSQRRNALGQAELSGITAALDSLESQTRVLVISAAEGPTFCAGADLQQIRAGELDGDQFQQVMSSLAKVPGAGEEQQTQQLRELLSAIEELHLCLEPLEAPCSDLVARLP